MSLIFVLLLRGNLWSQIQYIRNGTLIDIKVSNANLIQDPGGRWYYSLTSLKNPPEIDYTINTSESVSPDPSRPSYSMEVMQSEISAEQIIDDQGGNFVTGGADGGDWDESGFLGANESVVYTLFLMCMEKYCDLSGEFPDCQVSYPVYSLGLFPQSTFPMLYLQDEEETKGDEEENPEVLFDKPVEDPARCNNMGTPEFSVNTQTLSLVMKDREFTDQHPVLPFEITRHYVQEAPAGMFGTRWKMNYEMQMKKNSASLVFTSGSGKKIFFNPVKNGDTTVYLSISDNSDTVYCFGDTILRVNRSTDRRQIYLRTPADSQQYLIASIHHPSGYRINIQRNEQGKITGIKDAANRLYAFSYDASGLCTGISIPGGGSLVYTYDGNGSITTATDINGIKSTYSYQASGHITGLDVNGKNYLFSYTNGPLGIQLLADITAPDGKKTVYSMGVKAKDATQIQISSPGGKTSNILMDGKGRYNSGGYGLPRKYSKGLTEIYYPDGDTLRFFYNEQGDLTSVKNRFHTLYTYSYEQGKIQSFSDAMGNTWNYEYDPNGYLISEKDPAGNSTKYSYDGFGQILSITDANQHTTHFRYDTCGNVIQIISALGDTTHMKYDPQGFSLVSITDPRGNTTQFSYDGNLRLTQIRFPDGSTRSFTYDCCGQTSLTDENGHTVQYIRDGQGRPVQRMEATGSTSQFAYDDAGNLISFTDPLSRTTNFSYNTEGKIVKKTAPDGTTIQYEYNSTGMLSKITDERNNSYTFDYEKRKLYLIGFADMQYQIMQRDLLNRLYRYYNIQFQPVEFSYNFNGQVTEKKGNHQKISTYQYDAVGNLTRMDDSTGTTFYSYNAVNNVSSIQYPGNVKYNFLYDKAGNLSETKYSGGLNVQYEYDSRNRISAVKWNNQSIEMRYDKVGNITSFQRSNNIHSRMQYDKADRVQRMVHYTSADTLFRFVFNRDALGRISQEFMDHPYPGYLSDANENYRYNLNNQPVSDSYQFDAEGNVTQRIGYKNFLAEYNSENKLIRLKSSGRDMKIQYNGLNQIARIQEADTSYSYYYDALGNLLEIKNENTGQLVAQFIYAGKMPVAMVQQAQNFFYLFDRQGNVLALSDDNKHIRNFHSYTPFGEMIADSQAVFNPFTYMGAYGNIRMAGPVYHFKNRDYDAVSSRFLQRDPLGPAISTNLYMYAENDPVNSIDPNGLDPIPDFFSPDVRTGTANINTCSLPDNFKDNDLSDEEMEILRQMADMGTDMAPFIGDAKALGKMAWKLKDGDYAAALLEGGKMGAGKYIGGKLTEKIVSRSGIVIQQLMKKGMNEQAAKELVDKIADAASGYVTGQAIDNAVDMAKQINPKNHPSPAVPVPGQGMSGGIGIQY